MSTKFLRYHVATTLIMASLAFFGCSQDGYNKDETTQKQAQNESSNMEEVRGDNQLQEPQDSSSSQAVETAPTQSAQTDVMPTSLCPKDNPNCDQQAAGSLGGYPGVGGGPVGGPGLVGGPGPVGGPGLVGGPGILGGPGYLGGAGYLGAGIGVPFGPDASFPGGILGFPGDGPFYNPGFPFFTDDPFFAIDDDDRNHRRCRNRHRDRCFHHDDEDEDEDEDNDDGDSNDA